MENQEGNKKDQKTIDEFINDAQIHAKAVVLAAKIKKVVTNVAIGLFVAGAIAVAVVTVIAIEKSANQVPMVQPPSEENQETPVQE